MSNYPDDLSRSDLAYINGPRPTDLCVCGHQEQEHTVDGECCMEGNGGEPCQCKVMELEGDR